MGQYVSKTACHKREAPVFRFISVSAETAAPTAGETEKYTLNRTLFAAKWKSNWLNFEGILTVAHFWHFMEGQEFSAQVSEAGIQAQMPGSHCKEYSFRHITMTVKTL